MMARLDLAARQFVPLATALVLIVLGAAPWSVPFGGVVVPFFGLAAVYYWSLHRPDIFRPVTVFALGLFQDVIYGLPPGGSALIFVAVYQLVLSQRRYVVGHPFWMLWFGFAVVALLATLCQWFLTSLYHGQFLTIGPVLVQTALTLAVFPLLAWVFIRLHRLLAVPV